MPERPSARPNSLQVLHDDADDLPEAQRDDGQVVAAQAQRGQADTRKPQSAAAAPPASSDASRKSTWSLSRRRQPSDGDVLEEPRRSLPAM